MLNRVSWGTKRNALNSFFSFPAHEVTETLLIVKKIIMKLLEVLHVLGYGE